MLLPISLLRDADDYFVDWGRAADEVSRLIDAICYQSFGVIARLNGEVVNINDACAVPGMRIEDRRSAVGKVIFVSGGSPVVVCGSGSL